MAHAARIVAIVALITFFTFLPFLPGRYDSLAGSLSFMLQIFNRVGLLLVPVGVLWLALKRPAAGVAALITFSIVWLFVCLAALTESFILGFGAFLLWVYVGLKLVRRVRTMSTPGAIPLYLIVVPLAVAIIQFSFADAATELSRDRAIRNAAPLIGDIERHRVSNGRYPASVVSLHPDYWPSVIGIYQYHYEPTETGYNVFFEQRSFVLGMREIVMYNPRDEHRMTSHALDVLQLTPEQLALDRSRGHNALHAMRQPHWKYFSFD